MREHNRRDILRERDWNLSARARCSQYEPNEPRDRTEPRGRTEPRDRTEPREGAEPRDRTEAVRHLAKSAMKHPTAGAAGTLTR